MGQKTYVIKIEVTPKKEITAQKLSSSIRSKILYGGTKIVYIKEKLPEKE